MSTRTPNAKPGLALSIVTSTGGTSDVSLALSPSRASDFMRCPLLFRFRTLDRIPERPGSAAARGTLVHAVLERLFDFSPTSRTLQTAVELVEPAWDAIVGDSPELLCAVDPELPFPMPADTGPSPDQISTWLSAAKPLLSTYFNLEDPARLAPSARELAVFAELDDGTPLRGIIDRLDISPDGWLRVVDYKTGRSPGAGFEQRAVFQLRFYAVMLWRARGVVPKRLQLFYLGDGGTIRYEPSADDLEQFEAKLRALWKAVLTALESGDWRANPSKLCKWCDHHSRCPAQGGQAPPLPLVSIGQGPPPAARVNPTPSADEHTPTAAAIPS